MFIRKERGACSIGAYVWANDGDVVEVDDAFGVSLLEIKQGGFTEVIPKDLAEAEALRQGPKRTEDDLGVPTGSAKDVLAWVGDDTDRAELALKSERAKEEPRSTLIAELLKRTKAAA